MPGVTRAPGPGEPMPGQPTRTPGGGSSMTWNWNLGSINDYIDALMSRMPEMMDIQLARLREQPQRDARAFQEWLRKREWERTMEGRQQWEAEKAARERSSVLGQQMEAAENARRAEEERRRAFTNARGMQMRSQGYSAVPGAYGYGPANEADAIRELDRSGSGAGDISREQPAPPGWSEILWEQDRRRRMADVGPYGF